MERQLKSEIIGSKKGESRGREGDGVKRERGKESWREEMERRMGLEGASKDR